MESGRLFFDPSACHANMLFLGNGDAAFRGARSMMSIEETSKRRPFFSSHDDLFDEAYYDEQLPEKKRRLTPDQVHMLEKSFETENKLEPERKTQLAKKLGLQPRQVAVWFQNRRARWKTKQLERDYDVLKSSYDALLSNYETLVKENEKLKSEVVSLTEKVEDKKEENKEGKSGKKGDELGSEMGNNVSDILFRNKIEDRLSSGSGGSAVVDDQDGPQLVDSGDSYFPSDEYTGCMGAVDGGVQSEEEDGSDDSRSYFSDVLVAADDHHQHEEPMGWWVWS
ncbi:hypothetical protein ACOSP7_001751 [Xanthoceras sorbifolium]|uniref:Homeobox-leucine zipper protein n=1 Tax=Xanthoceras sorbifolium TaxID=99658 RepID=A0ABQ8ILK3_9ROSI|nr:hypothetical protein JRO89_XS01G0241900 [Xanthoceras sorbifolium]